MKIQWVRVLLYLAMNAAILGRSFKCQISDLIAFDVVERDVWYSAEFNKCHVMKKKRSLSLSLPPSLAQEHNLVLPLTGLGIYEYC